MQIREAETNNAGRGTGYGYAKASLGLGVDDFNDPDSGAGTVKRRQLPWTSSQGPSQRRTGQSGGFRQQNLFGETIGSPEPAPTQLNRNRSYLADRPAEPPTHHQLDREALRTWVYPMNLGPIRDYQYTIVRNGLFNNTLVALPTGLGKTFIAATIMLNYYRWTVGKHAKIVFVAPTKPLAAQQVEACLGIAGIPRSDTTLLTGETSPAVRAEEWQQRRVFFMTPQTLHNDLSRGFADPKDIVLLVIDEAHRATGEYAYAKVVRFIRRFQNSFRVLALTATPGSTVETVQEVIDNLGISHIEIRTEDSIDIRQYVHQRSIEEVVLDPSDEILLVRELFSKALKPIVEKLTAQNMYWGRDPLAITTYGLLKAKEQWLKSAGRTANHALKGMVMSISTMLMSLAHSLKLLNFHGIKPFYNSLVEFRSGTGGEGFGNGKYKQQLLRDPSFQEMMDKMSGWFRTDGFVSHPKVTYLCDAVLNHFLDAGEGSSTRIIVFCEYRDSAEEIVRVLNTHRPTVRATVFVGQADSKRSEGMKQAEQLQTIERFKSGALNVIVATSIGEEGLDIGQVDLIVCYDASASPIRMLQRMGRTGRKRAGRIVLLLMRGKEEEQYAKAKDNYAQMQKLICEGSRFNFRLDLSSRIVPRDIKPQADKRLVDIPPENTRDKSLPEPKKPTTRKKLPPKKFHMPDGVETGFQTALNFGKPAKPKQAPPSREEDDLFEIPPIDSVSLTKAELLELNRVYREVPKGGANVIGFDHLDFRKFYRLQRTGCRVVRVKHSRATRRMGRLFRNIDAVKRDGCDTPDEDWIVASDLRRWPADFIEEGDTPFQNETESMDKPSKKRRLADTDSKTASSPEVPRRQRQKTARSKPLPSRPKPKQAGTLQSMADEGPEIEDENSEDDVGSDGRLRKNKAGRRRRGRGGGKARASSSGRGRLRGGAGDELYDYGDDVMRDSDMLETDGSDDGADLKDFIVGTDEITSSMQRPVSTSPTSLSQSPGGRSGLADGKPSYVPIEIPSTQDGDDDDEFLELGDLLQKTGKGKTTGRRPREAAAGYKAARRRVIESDSDDV